MGERILAILAAGKGERLRPLTETRPKPLMTVAGEELLCRHIRMLRGYSRVIVVGSYMLDKLEAASKRCGGPVEVIDQGGELGTGHALLKALEYGGPGEYTVVYGDVFMSPSLYRALESSKQPSILASTTDKPWEYGVLLVEDGILRGVVEKPRPGEEPGNLVFIGGLKADYDLVKGYLERLKPSPRGELELTDALTMMAGDWDVRVVVGDGYWIDIGRPWDLLRANRLALEHELSPAVEGEVAGTSVIGERVYIGPGARIGHYTVIEGPAYIGPGARIGPHAHIREYTVVGPGARIGFSSQVKASILMEGAKAPHLNYVGDSIVGEHVNLGAGTITANLRFDESTVKMRIKGKRVDTGMRKLGAVIGGYAKTGINVSIYPGVKIGSHAWIDPGCIVYRDVCRGEHYRCRV